MEIEQKLPQESIGIDNNKDHKDFKDHKENTDTTLLNSGSPSSSSNLSNLVTKENIDSVFPINILKFVIALYNDDEFHHKTYTNPVDLYEFNKVLLQIIFNILNYQKFHYHYDKNFIEYFDLSKFFLSSDLIVSEEIFKRFMNKLFINITSFFKAHINNFLDLHIIKKDYESYLFINVQIFLSLIYDYNKQFFTNVKEKEYDELFFETEFNEKAYKFINSYLLKINPSTSSSTSTNSNTNIIEAIKNYNIFFKEILISIIQYSSKNFIDFINLFLDNYEKIVQTFQIFVKILIIYFFEIYPDFSEIITLNKDFLGIVFEKLSLNDSLDLLLFNKILVTKNFYIMNKFLNISLISNNTSNSKSSNTDKIHSLAEKCLSCLIEKCKKLGGNISGSCSGKLDSISFLLMTMFYNM